MKIALDTTILLYAEGLHGAARQYAARQAIASLATADRHIPAQVLGEFFAVLIRKAGATPSDARARLAGWHDAAMCIPTTGAVLARAVDLATDHHLSIWDAIILAAAAEAGCRLLLSEDLQHGFTWSGVTIVNPFKSPSHPLLPQSA